MTSSSPQSPACSLDAQAFQERVNWIAALNRQFGLSAQRLGNVLTLTYELTALPHIEEMAAREKSCCGFLAFEVMKDTRCIQLRITVPAQITANIDELLMPFQGSVKPAGTATCFASDEKSARSVKAGAVSGTALATSATAVIACGACCVLPIAFPAIATATAGGAIAWLAGAHTWLTAVALVIVILAWFWIWRQSAKLKARAATSTLILMALASVVLLLALVWSRIEAWLITALML